MTEPIVMAMQHRFGDENMNMLSFFTTNLLGTKNRVNEQYLKFVQTLKCKVTKYVVTYPQTDTIGNFLSLYGLMIDDLLKLIKLYESAEQNSHIKTLKEAKREIRHASQIYTINRGMHIVDYCSDSEESSSDEAEIYVSQPAPEVVHRSWRDELLAVNSTLQRWQKQTISKQYDNTLIIFHEAVSVSIKQFIAGMQMEAGTWLSNFCGSLLLNYETVRRKHLAQESIGLQTEFINNPEGPSQRVKILMARIEDLERQLLVETKKTQLLAEKLKDFEDQLRSASHCSTERSHLIDKRNRTKSRKEHSTKSIELRMLGGSKQDQKMDNFYMVKLDGPNNELNYLDLKGRRRNTTEGAFYTVTSNKDPMILLEAKRVEEGPANYTSKIVNPSSELQQKHTIIERNNTHHDFESEQKKQKRLSINSSKGRQISPPNQKLNAPSLNNQNGLKSANTLQKVESDKQIFNKNKKTTYNKDNPLESAQGQKKRLRLNTSIKDKPLSKNKLSLTRKESKPEIIISKPQKVQRSQETSMKVINQLTLMLEEEIYKMVTTEEDKMKTFFNNMKKDNLISNQMTFEYFLNTLGFKEPKLEKRTPNQQMNSTQPNAGKTVRFTSQESLNSAKKGLLDSFVDQSYHTGHSFEGSITDKSTSCIEDYDQEIGSLDFDENIYAIITKMKEQCVLFPDKELALKYEQYSKLCLNGEFKIVANFRPFELACAQRLMRQLESLKRQQKRLYQFITLFLVTPHQVAYKPPSQKLTLIRLTRADMKQVWSNIFQIHRSCEKANQKRICIHFQKFQAFLMSLCRDLIVQEETDLEAQSIQLTTKTSKSLHANNQLDPKTGVHLKLSSNSYISRKNNISIIKPSHNHLSPKSNNNTSMAPRSALLLQEAATAIETRILPPERTT